MLGRPQRETNLSKGGYYQINTYPGIFQKALLASYGARRKQPLNDRIYISKKVKLNDCLTTATLCFYQEKKTCYAKMM